MQQAVSAATQAMWTILNELKGTAIHFLLYHSQPAYWSFTPVLVVSMEEDPSLVKLMASGLVHDHIALVIIIYYFPYDEIEDGRCFSILVYNDKTGSMRKEFFAQ